MGWNQIETRLKLTRYKKYDMIRTSYFYIKIEESKIIAICIEAVLQKGMYVH